MRQSNKFILIFNINLFVQAPLEERSKNVCKVNGEISFNISDLYSKPYQTPLFGQLYIIDAQKAIEYRDQHLQAKPYNVKIHETVLTLLDAIMRNHPFAKSYIRADDVYQKEVKKRAKKGNPDIPSFRVNKLWIY